MELLGWMSETRCSDVLYEVGTKVESEEDRRRLDLIETFGPREVD